VCPGSGPPVDWPGLVRVDHRLDTVAQPELGEHPPEVCLHCRLGEEEPFGNRERVRPIASVASGGVACVAGALVIARLLPGFRYLRSPATSDHGG